MPIPWRRLSPVAAGVGLVASLPDLPYATRPLPAPLLPSGSGLPHRLIAVFPAVSSSPLINPGMFGPVLEVLDEHNILSNSKASESIASNSFSSSVFLKL